MLTLEGNSSRNKSPNKGKYQSCTKQEWRPHLQSREVRHSHQQTSDTSLLYLQNSHLQESSDTSYPVTESMPFLQANNSAISGNNLDTSILDFLNPNQSSFLLNESTSSSLPLLFSRCYSEESRLTEYSCLVCNYRSKKICNMKAHVRTHNQEKPFPCPKCSYRANQMSNLKAHVLRHHSLDFQNIFSEPPNKNIT